MSLEDAAKMALEALEHEADGYEVPPSYLKQAIEALRAELAEAPKAEPVAWCKPADPEGTYSGGRLHLMQDYDHSGGYGFQAATARNAGWQPLYLHPPAREAESAVNQQLTTELIDEEIIAIRDEHLPAQGEPFDCIAFARAVLAHGRK